MNETQNPPRHIPDWLGLVGRIFAGLLCGSLSAFVIYRITQCDKIWIFLMVGAFIGAVVGVIWQPMIALWTKFQSEEWRITEIELGTDGPTWKLANGSSQRRVAWSLFVELATRVVTQPMSGTEGDDCAALNSLYQLFNSVRKIISEMEPTPLLSGDSLDTVETYSLAMLNQDLRPFLAKWHPKWDQWEQSHKDKHCSDWEQHEEFRRDLERLRQKIITRAKGLGKIAKVSDIDRFLTVAPRSENESLN